MSQQDSMVQLCPSVELFMTRTGELYLLPAADKPQMHVETPYGQPVYERLRAGSPFDPARFLSSLPAAMRLPTEQILEALVDEKLIRRTDDLGSWDPTTPFDRQQRYFAQAGCNAGSAQLRLGTATVVVLGVGGVGGAVAEGLCRAGIGTVVCVDHDVVGFENLGRQTLFTSRDIGRQKVAAARDRLRDIAPWCEVITEMVRIDSPGSIARIARDHDAVAVAACIDTPQGSIGPWLAEACHEVAAAYVTAGQRPPMVSAGPFVSPDSSFCLSCLDDHLELTPLEHELRAFRAASTYVVPAIGSADLLAASLVVQDLISYVSGVGTPALSDRRVHIDLRTLGIEWGVPTTSCQRCSLPKAS